jgi:hypothetical protein
MEQSLAVNDTHKAGNIGNMVEGNGFPRVDSLVRILALALRRTCRVEHLIEQTDNRWTSGCDRPATHLHVIIAVFSLSNSIPPPSDLRVGPISREKRRWKDVLFIHQGCYTSICLLRTFEEFIPRKAQQNLRIDSVLAHERLVIGHGLRSLADWGPAEDRVRARFARRACYVQEIRGRRAQSEEKGHRAEDAARRELCW